MKILWIHCSLLLEKATQWIIWWEREKAIDASWLILYFPLSSYSIACHTSVFNVVSYICLIKKNSFWFILKLILLVRQFASEIVDGSAVLFLSQCPKFTELFLLNFWLFLKFCYIMLIKAIFSNYVPKMEQTALSGTRLFGNLKHF